ncbi:restriction endonuclease [Burkholderia sp. R-69980]|nr:restriction endonuclease [Burkholderia sp. R-69980]
MPENSDHEWILPASIPFTELKGKDLEACVYWLLDAMGAKDLEWRIGGTGGGAADGGRDLEAHFFEAADDGELRQQRWWIECKGRTGTVESHEVKAAVNNALAYDGLDRLIIVTNTQYSNPTRDWVKEWQKKHPTPKVQLWDHSHLERYLSRHPDVVLRLFSEALSIQGRAKAMESRFWNTLEYVPLETLADLWKERDAVEFTAMGIFALIANEFANGDVTNRPWGAAFGPESAAQVLGMGLANIGYLLLRSSRAGIDQRPLIRTFVYLILVLLEVLPADSTADLVTTYLNRNQSGHFPEDVQDLLLGPIVDQLLSEMEDICSDDCRRIMSSDRQALTNDKDEVETYWLRFDPEGVDEEKERRFFRLEKVDEPCAVGFPVDKDNGCPLFAFKPTASNLSDMLETVKRVAAFRKAQAAVKRAKPERQMDVQRTTKRVDSPGD